MSIAIVQAPLRREPQSDGRIRFWGEVIRPGETQARILRVVTLEDGETIHNAFFDRGFRSRRTCRNTPAARCSRSRRSAKRTRSTRCAII